MQLRRLLLLPHIRAARAEDGTLCSGSIHTLNKPHVRFGRIEVRAKLPKGQGDRHLCTVEWTPETITFFFDTVQHTRVELKDIPQFQGENPFHRPFCLLLNLAVGGGRGGDLDESILPVTCQVDSVRYRQRSGG